MSTVPYAPSILNPYPPLELPPLDEEPNWWPINSAQQAAMNCKAELLLMGGQSGGGKLMDVNEPIPTPRGFVRNGDLCAGDLIFGQDGKQYSILAAHPVEEVESFKVVFDDGTWTFVHAGHLWHTFTHKERLAAWSRSPEVRARRRAKRPPRGTGERPWMVLRNKAAAVGYESAPVLGSVRTTKEISRTLGVQNCQRANHSIRLTAPIEMQTRWLPIDPYVLGAWLGDGSSDCGAMTISAASASEMLRRFKDAGEPLHRLTAAIAYNRIGLKAKLRSLKVLGNKHIPEQYLWTCAEQRLALLRGLMDTDGCCNRDGQVEFCNTRELLARGVYQLAASLGMKPFWSEGRATLYGRDCGPKYMVKWTGLLPCFTLTKKKRRLPKKVRSTQTWRYIIDVQPAGVRPMRCLTTSNPTGLYLFGRNFNVTHNTQYLAADACQEYRNPALRGLLLRTTLEEMQELEDIQQRMYEPLGARWWRKRWRFASGATIRPGYLAHDKHLNRYQGNPFSWLGIDESGQHPEHRIRYMIGWLTAPTQAKLRVRGRLTSNPGGIGHGWQMKVFLRNRCPVHNAASFEDDRPFETSVWPGRVYRGACWTDDSPVHKTTAFIPARLADNPLYGREKLESLLSQSKAVQQQLLYGCWCNAAGLYFDFLRPDDVIPYQTIVDAWWWLHFFSIDYGYGNSAAAAGMYAQSPNGRVFKTRERVERKMPALKFAQAICEKGFDRTDYPAQGPQTHWLTKFKPRDPERPRVSFCVMDSAMDQHRGVGKSIYRVMADVFEKNNVPCIKAAHDPAGNAQNLYNGLSSKMLVMTRDSSDLPLSYRSISSRVVDERKAVKKIHGAWEDDCFDESSYFWNTFRQNSAKPARTALEEELAQLRSDGVDETTLARIAWQREQAIRKDEAKVGKGITLGTRRGLPKKG